MTKQQIDQYARGAVVNPLGNEYQSCKRCSESEGGECRRRHLEGHVLAQWRYPANLINAALAEAEEQPIIIRNGSSIERMKKKDKKRLVTALTLYLEKHILQIELPLRGPHG